MRKGLLYLGSGEEYRKHAIWSAKQSQNFINYPIALVTDAKPDDTVFDKVIVDPTLSQSFFDKTTALRQSPFDKTVFLDCDAYVIGDISELFDLLDSSVVYPGVFQSLAPRHRILLLDSPHRFLQSLEDF